MIRIYNSVLPRNPALLKEMDVLTAYLGIIVNPMGPTMMAVVTPIPEPNRTQPLYWLSLNPWSQRLEQVGEAQLTDESIVQDLKSLGSVIGQSSCPTLIDTHHAASGQDLEDVLTHFILSFPDAESVWGRLLQFPGDPWNRVSADMEQVPRPSPSSCAEVGPSKSWPTDFARFLRTRDHLLPEVQAFRSAWEGSIDFQRSMGNRAFAETGLPFAEAVHWLIKLAASTASLGPTMFSPEDTHENSPPR